MTDEDVDTSDYANTKLQMPKDKISVIVNIDPKTMIGLKRKARNAKI